MKIVTNSLKLLVVVVAMLIAGTSHATLIVGSTPPGPNYLIVGFNFGPDNYSYGISFTMPGQSYLLTDVVLSLSDYGGPTESQVRIYEDGVGFITTLTDPPALPGLNNFVFTPSSVVTLEANKTYFLTLDMVDFSSTWYFWHWSAGGLLPGVGTYNGGLFSQNSDPFTPERIPIPSFEINGTLVAPASTSVPDAGSTLTLLLATLVGLGLSRREVRRKLFPSSAR